MVIQGAELIQIDSPCQDCRTAEQDIRQMNGGNLILVNAIHHMTVILTNTTEIVEIEVLDSLPVRE